ncbi:MAG: hypothetical protein KDA21_13765, partial [Phycisphaerales bacterium]|nr:hypothetical protein [Phycisphaerales bacterium]
VITENARVHAFATALRRTDLATAGHLMTESHVSLSRTYRVSCPEADALVKRLVQRPGVHGARMTGAGFGGWVVALMEPTEAARLTHELAHTTMLLHAGDGCHAGAGST